MPQTTEQWRSRIDQAIASGGLIFHCQPIYALGSIKPSLFEVLCRLQEPSGEIIPAARFMREVTDEQWQAIDKLAVLGTLEHLKQSGMPHAINLSAATLNNLQFPSWLSDQLKLSGVLPSLLLIELSEDAQIYADTKALFSVTALRSLSLPIALDDFAVGFANIPGLLALDPDFLKVDGSIVRMIAGFHADQIRQSIVYMSMAYCYYRRIAIILEFVENGEILMQIQKMAEDFPRLQVFVQGHFELFGEARPC